MEDFFSVAYQQTADEKDLEYAFFGIYDGHGGGEAATFAKEHLMESIVRQKNFWSEKDEDVLKAIKDGYINTHYAMWKEQEKWPKTAAGLPSTAGTTASVAFIRRGKIYIGHVGDSGIILGYQEPGNPNWRAKQLTEDHKPENKSEMTRIKQCGGKVIIKSGIPRVVWNRPRIGHKGPVRRSTPIDEIPFLAVARSLGDLWSYNSALDEFVVSPDPDTTCISIDADTFRCLIFGTDGLWNMITPEIAVKIVQVAEQHNEHTVLASTESNTVEDPNQHNGMNRSSKVWINPSKCLVERALELWTSSRMRADNTSVITLMLDPPGPPRAEVIKNQRLNETKQMQQLMMSQHATHNAHNNVDQAPSDDHLPAEPPRVCPPQYPETGLEIMYKEDPQKADQYGTNCYVEQPKLEGRRQPSPSRVYEELGQSSNCTKEINQNIETPDRFGGENGSGDSKEKPEAPKETKNPVQITNRRYTEEYLNKIHQQVLNSNSEEDAEPSNLLETCPVSSEPSSSSKGNTKNDLEVPVAEAETKREKIILKEKKPSKNSLESNDIPISSETIQINEVSSSSSLDKFVLDEAPCEKCTRSNTNLLKNSNRKSLRSNTFLRPAVLNSSSRRSTSESPKRKTRSMKANSTTGRLSVVTGRRSVAAVATAASKREYSDPELAKSGPADSTRLTNNNNVEPPHKLRRSQSLGPRDFTLRSTTDLHVGRSLRDRVVPRKCVAGTFKRIGTIGKQIAPVRQAIHTRNRVKRLNNK